MKYHNMKSSYGVMSDKEIRAEFTEFEALIDKLYPKDWHHRRPLRHSNEQTRIKKGHACRDCQKKTDPILVPEDDKTDNCQSAAHLDALGKNEPCERQK